MSEQQHTRKSEAPQRTGRKIRIREDYELNYWCGRLDCNRTELREAIRSVGDSEEAVIRHLSKRSQPETRHRKGGFPEFYHKLD